MFHRKLLSVILLLASVAVQGQITINNLPPATTPLVGNELTIVQQSGSTKQTSVSNVTGTAPLLKGAVIAVKAIATSVITLSGSQTIDGIGVGNGELVLVTANTPSNTSRGIFVVSSAGSWSRSSLMPSGLIIPQFTQTSIIAKQGNTLAGTIYELNTLSGNITVDTSGQSWNPRPPSAATATTFGTSIVTDGLSSLVAGVASPPSGVVGGATGDCASFNGVNGSIADLTISTSVIGPCMVTDQQSHPIFSSTAPTVTGAGCSLANTLPDRPSDNKGAVVATGADTCTITYHSSFNMPVSGVIRPVCVVSGYSSAVAPVITTAPSTTAFTVTTAAAGTFAYHCL